MSISHSASPKSYIKKTWPIIIFFFTSTLIDPLIGLAGLICIAFPLTLALTGKGKRHCSHYCPRGSFLGKFLPQISFGLPFPRWMDSKIFKMTLLIWMFGIFGISIFFAGTDLIRLAQVITRIMFASFIIGIIIGLLFQPRSWCKICPMGTASGLISKTLTKNRDN